MNISCPKSAFHDFTNDIHFKATTDEETHEFHVALIVGLALNGGAFGFGEMAKDVRIFIFGKFA